jgi:hypothetical protein
MEKVIRVFHSFSEADAADAAEDRSMTPEQRVAMVFELRERLYPDAAQPDATQPDAAGQGFARVYRVIEREQS